MNSTQQNRLIRLFVLASAAASAVAQGTYAQYGEVVHSVGDPVPAAAPGVTPAAGSTIFATGNFDAPIIDQNGTILYRARFTGGGVTTSDDRGFIMGRVNGDLRMVLRAGDQAPGCPAGTLLRSSSTTAGSNGLVAPRISPFGELLYFQSTLFDPNTTIPATADTALFWGPVGSYVLLAREGDPVPFLGTGETYGPFLGFSLQYNVINTSGRVVFEVQLLGGASTTANDGCLVTGTPGNLAIVSREGDVFPGGEVVMPITGTTQLTFLHQLNEVGQILHELRFATALPSTATTANDRAVAIWTPGFGDTIIAREGQQAPGLPAGVLFATPSLGWSATLSNCSFTKSGNTVLLAQLDGGGTVVGTDDYALYYGGASGLNLVLRRGMPCPGLGNGETFGVVNGSSMGCNDAGQLSFISSLAGASVTSANDSSLWFGTAANLQMIAREGDPVPGYAGWTFQAVNGGSNNGLINERGQMLVQLGITDGTNFKSVLFGWTPELGLHVQTEVNGTSTFTTPLGTGVPQSMSSNAGFASGDSSQTHFNNNGDFVLKPGFPAPVTAAIVRGHLGSLIAEPSSFSAAAGGTQNFHLDCGPSHANQWHWIIATTSGTRPGFPSPLGPQMIPLNFDTWTQLSIDLADTPVWSNTLWFTDAAGKSSASFTLPGFPSLIGTTFHHAAVLFDSSLVGQFVSEPVSCRLY